LVGALVVVVRDELAQGSSQHRLADEDHLGEALVLDGPHEALGECVVGNVVAGDHAVAIEARALRRGRR
jgi:hypothetical protein